MEKSTGVHAFEVLIDRHTGAVFPEPDPNMMWNTRYGYMRTMMRNWSNWSTVAMPVSPEKAGAFAQQWLDRFLLATSVADEAHAFYGYYTIHIMKDGQVYGMLSVNGYSGQV
jgi:hypothetical protein